MKVAIDGPAGSGKSTIARALAERCGLTMIDTGAMYRSVTLACHERGVPVTDADAVAEVARAIHIEFGVAADGTQTVLVDGRDVTTAIRTPEVDADVSVVSAVPAVREEMVAQQRRMGETGDVVAEGRDIGTVVFPDAEVKVFLTADPAARAHRRALQRNVEDPAQEQAILADLRRRDDADSSREVAPLAAAEDAVLIDSSNLTVEEELDQIAALVRAAHEDKGDAAKPADDKPVAAAAPEPVAAPVAEADKPAAVPAAEPVTKPASPAADKPAADDTKKEEGPYDRFYEGAMREFSLGSRFVLGATIWVTGALSKLLWPWRIENGEAMWNAEGGQMVIMNHVSMIDPVILAVSDWMHGRRLRPIYKSEFDKSRILRWLYARLGAIPVKRGTADIKAVRRAQRALQRGEDILVFPEGTRIHSDDQEVTIHGGFALMAQLAKAPVLPVAIVGARDGVPGGNGMLRPHRIYLRAGDPITFDQLGEKKRKKQAQAMERVAMDKVYELRDALQAEHPGKA